MARANAPSILHLYVVSGFEYLRDDVAVHGRGHEHVDDVGVDGDANWSVDDREWCGNAGEYGGVRHPAATSTSPASAKPRPMRCTRSSFSSVKAAAGTTVNAGAKDAGGATTTISSRRIAMTSIDVATMSKTPAAIASERAEPRGNGTGSGGECLAPSLSLRRFRSRG